MLWTKHNGQPSTCNLVLRFYSRGQLDEFDIVSYVRTNALLYEYYKQAFEQMPKDIGDELVRLFNSEAFIIVNTSTAQILGNIGKSHFNFKISPLNLLLKLIMPIFSKVALNIGLWGQWTLGQTFKNNWLTIMCLLRVILLPF